MWAEGLQRASGREALEALLTGTGGDVRSSEKGVEEEERKDRRIAECGAQVELTPIFALLVEAGKRQHNFRRQQHTEPDLDESGEWHSKERR